MSKDQKRYGHRQPEDRTEAEGRQLRWRSGVMVGLFAAALCVYCGVLYNIQVVHGADYQAIAAANTSMQTETVDAVRGDILDSHGRVLVTNESAYQVSLDSSLMGDARNEILTQLLALCREEGVEWTDTFPVTDSAPYSFTKPDVYTYLYTKKDDQGNTVSQEQRRTNLGALAVFYKWMDDPLDDEPKQDAVTYLDAETLMVKMCGTYGIELDEENAEITSEIRDLLGVLYELSLRSRQITYSEYVFAENVDITFITKVKEFGLDGVAFETETTRKYNTTYAAHVLGRTGKYTSDEMWEKYKALGYPYDAVVGLQGAELAFEEYLHGTSGNRKVVTSDSGKIVSQEWEEEPVPGGNVTLTLDIGMQKVAEDAIAAHAASLEKAGGAAVAVVDMTGGVKALASYPTYDLSTYGQDIGELSADPLKPLFNRATSELYSPGSTFKLVTAIAGLMEGIIDPSDTIFCGGSYTVEGWTMGDGRPFRAYCHQRSGHGTENLVKAIKDSCNVYFYDVGRRVGIEKLNEYAKMFGLGQHTGIETGDAEGTIAGPETSKANNQAWYDGATLYAAIGQENNQFTPLQIANYLATLVNGGDRYSVHLLDSVRSHDNSELLYQYEPELLSSIGIPEDYLATIKEGMYQVSQNAAIARYFNNLPVRVGAKTGTAEIQGGEDSETNGLLVVFAPYDDPEIALCIVMEQGASGSSLASVAYQILDYYFSSDAAITGIAQENTLIP